MYSNLVLVRINQCDLHFRLHLFGFSGTTEKIFEEKKELYDVYIDNQNVKTHRESLQPLLRLNSADREKYRKLCEQRYTSLLKSERLI